MRSLFCVVLLSAIPYVDCQAVQVESPSGTFEGVASTINAFGQTKNYVQFLGIPYAEPPTGNRRFMKPVRKAPFTEPYNATFLRPSCHQARPTVLGGTGPKSEDCLFLNIYAPDSILTNSSEQLAVIFFIHGGGFALGSSNNVHPADVLVTTGNVIVVSINYRLSVFGFLSSGDETMPGNLGLWDQQLALQWVNTNIESFGGDSNLVTIQGFSTGGVSSLLHALYPGNRGLFRRSIVDSADGFATYEDSPVFSVPQAAAYSSFLNCSLESNAEILICLQDKSDTELIDAVQANPKIKFLPVHDGEFVKAFPKQAFERNTSATQDMRDMFASVDLLIGVCGSEGGVVLQELIAPMQNTTWVNLNVTRAFFDDVAVPFVSDRVFQDKTNEDIEAALRYEYSDLKDPENTDTDVKLLLQMSSAFEYFVPSVLAANYHSNQESSRKTYFYEFTPMLSFLELFRPTFLTSANHGDTTIFSFGFSPGILATFGFPPLQSAAEKTLSKQMILMWTNFAKSGDPNSPVVIPDVPRWPLYSSVTRPYLELSLDMTDAVKFHFGEPDMTFWLDILPRFVTETEETMPPSETDCKLERFNLDVLQAENVMIILIILAACLLIFIILTFCFICFRRKSVKHDLQKL